MKIRHTIWIYIVSFAMASAIVVYSARTNLDSSRTIQTHWLQFQQDSSIKDGALNTIFHNIGFSGAIDYYKLYILQGNPQLPAQIRNRLENAITAANKYQSLSTSREETIALERVKLTLNLYEQNITRIEKMLGKGLSAREIDIAVKVDDNPALEAFQILTRADSDSLHTNDSKVHILNHLRRSLGYGGITHNLYNYLLRGERSYRDATWQSIREANQIINTYQSRELSEEEVESLDTIQSGIISYAERLGTIEHLKNAGMISARDISHLIVVDRIPILSAFDTLEQGIIIDNEKASLQLQQALDTITVSSQMMLFMIIGFTSLLLLSLYWFVNNRIVRPLNTLSHITDRLSHEETDIDIPLTGQNNEIGLLARSIKIFKKNILLRQHAEEELKQINLDLSLQVEQESQQVDFYSRHLSNLLENAVDAIITADKHGVILSFNQAACHTFGYSADEILGKNVSLLMPDTHAIKHDQYLHNYFRSGKAKVMGTGRELNGKRKTGEEFPIDVALTTLEDQGQIYITAFIRDISLLKEQEKQIRQAQKMDALGQLTGGIAHDYNNMLGVISGFSELLEQIVEPDSPAKEYVEQISHAAGRGSKLTAKLLGFSRNTRSEPELIDINQTIYSQQHMLEKALMVDLTLTMTLCPQACLTSIDSAELEDAILNMSINAMHAMPNGGELRIETAIVPPPANISEPLANNYIVISIQDSGTGIPQAIQHRIFEPFFSTKGDKGTGLGLSQTYGFVQRSNGHIELESSTSGTTFRIYLPEYEAEIATANKLANSDEPVELSGTESILIVDDEPSLLALIYDILEPYGYKVSTTENAVGAQELLQQQKFDLVISDIIMPGMNGYDLASWIRSHFPHCKIQLISGYDKHGKDHDVDIKLQERILKKPFSSSVLLKTIRERLNET
ncbi:MAG: PAS domain S-box protein [Gammaproteobacteria bacterium]|nr:PAS domain S-box protein [Gammaproteobacteria bacterium]